MESKQGAKQKLKRTNLANSQMMPADVSTFEKYTRIYKAIIIILNE